MRGIRKTVVIGVVASLGLLTSVAAEAHGDGLSGLARAGTALTGAAHGGVISALAKVNGGANRVRTAHGDVVSALARHRTAEAAHLTGAKRTDHGGVISALASKR